MISRIILPQLGQTMEEGTVEKWHKTEGDEVKKGEALFDLTTDKATLEVESFAEGILRKIVVPEGETVPVNAVVALVGDQDDELPEDIGPIDAGVDVPAPVLDSAGPEAAKSAAPQPTPVAESMTAADPSRISASPRAKKLAEENSVTLAALQGRGTGPDGRVVQRDVVQYIDQLDAVKTTPAARRTACLEDVDLLRVQPAEGERITKQDVLDAAQKAAGMAAPVELSAMRSTIAKRMTMSKQTVPHFYLVARVNMRQASIRRKELNTRDEVHITFTDMLVKAVAAALEKHPKMNARFERDAIVLNPEINIGVAVAVDDGLFVPVIHGAGSKPLPRVSSELATLAAAAREGCLIPEQYEGGSITISNLGTYGIDSFLPIINPPESCIFGIGSIREEIVVENGAMRIEPLMTVSLSADHRLTDGASAAAFFNSFREALEEPAWMFDDL